MPVLDHEVHPSTIQGPGHRYGCHDHEEYAATFTTKHGHRLDGTVVFKETPHTLSRECRYDLSTTDPNCSGCKHRGKGEDYDRMVREGGR